MNPRRTRLLLGTTLPLFILLAASTFVLAPRPALSQSGSSLTGWMWAGDTIGWISASCTDTSICLTSNYGFSIDADGLITGYGWSETIGWVSANPSNLAGCPSAPCEARIGGNALTGWLRAIAGGTAQSGSWDGWISISGTNWGPVLQNDGYFTGFLWGDSVVGWADAALLHTNYEPCQLSYTCNGQTIVRQTPQCTVEDIATCQAPAFCASGSAVCLVPEPRFTSGTDGNGHSTSGHLQVLPTVVRPGTTAKLFWNLSYVQGCTVTGTNGDRYTGIASGATGTSTAPIAGRTTFTLHCAAYDGGSPPSVDESVTVSVAPSWREI